MVGNGIVRQCNLALAGVAVAILGFFLSFGLGPIGLLISLAALGYAAFHGISAYNALAQFWARINEGMQNLKSSRDRKDKLGKDVIRFAERVGRQEHVTHTGLQRELRRASEAMSSGHSPTAIFASLSTNFPVLNTHSAFRDVHQQFVTAEAKIDSELRALNALIGEWNGILSSFPLEQLSRQLPFSRVKFRA